jgi:hypothetical protein
MDTRARQRYRGKIFRGDQSRCTCCTWDIGRQLLDPLIAQPSLHRLDIGIDNDSAEGSVRGDGEIDPSSARGMIKNENVTVGGIL